MVSMLPDNDAVILNGVYWLFATKFVFLNILMFKTFITRVTFITPSPTLSLFTNPFYIKNIYLTLSFLVDKLLTLYSTKYNLNHLSTYPIRNNPV
jgi:hypothetical protein